MGSFSFFLLLSLVLLAHGRHIRGDQGDPDTFLNTSPDNHFNTLLVTYPKISLGNQSEGSVNRTKRRLFLLAFNSLHTYSTVPPLFLLLTLLSINLPYLGTLPETPPFGHHPFGFEMLTKPWKKIIFCEILIAGTESYKFF